MAARMSNSSGELDNADGEQRRETRRKYREFIQDLQEKKEDLIAPESDELNERLREADELFKPVHHTREAVLDSTAIGIISNLGRQKAQALHTEFVSFQPAEFAEKLILFTGGQGPNEEGARISSRGWAELGKAVQPYFKRSPPFVFMAGSFERGPKPAKEPKERRAKQADNVAGKATVPTQLKDFTQSDKNEATTEEVERVYDLLKRMYEKEDCTPLDYFEFVLNPDSFGQTVENIFYVSFLIRDNLAEMLIDDDGLPVIKPLDDEEDQRNRNPDQKRHQTVISITPKEWKELVEVFKVEEPSIPLRSSENEKEDVARKKSKS